MKINVKSKHMEITPAIEQYAEKKVERLPRYFDRVQQIEVLIDREKKAYNVEIIVDVEKHDSFVATSEDEDLYAAIDVGVDRMIRQLTDHKKKLRDDKHHTPASGTQS